MDKETKKEFQNLSKLVEKRFDKVESEITDIRTDVTGLKLDMAEVKAEVKRIDQRTEQTYKLLDGYVKSQEDFKQEFEVMKHKVTKIEKVIKDELGVEI